MFYEYHYNLYVFLSCLLLFGFFLSVFQFTRFYCFFYYFYFFVIMSGFIILVCLCYFQNTVKKARLEDLLEEMKRQDKVDKENEKVKRKKVGYVWLE